MDLSTVALQRSPDHTDRYCRSSSVHPAIFGDSVAMPQTHDFQDEV